MPLDDILIYFACPQILFRILDVRAVRVGNLPRFGEYFPVENVARDGLLRYLGCVGRAHCLL